MKTRAQIRKTESVKLRKQVVKDYYKKASDDTWRYSVEEVAERNKISVPYIYKILREGNNFKRDQ